VAAKQANIQKHTFHLHNLVSHVFHVNIISHFFSHLSVYFHDASLLNFHTYFPSSSTMCPAIGVSIINHKHVVRSQVLTMASIKMAAFWVVAPCTFIEVYRRFRGLRCLHHQVENSVPTGKLLPEYTAQQTRK
jgi:hypothetical protein